MLVKESTQRLALHKLLEHPWIVQNADPSGLYRGWSDEARKRFKIAFLALCTTYCKKSDQFIVLYM